MTDDSLLWDAFWQGYRQGYGVEDMSDLDRRAARSAFEQWSERNHNCGVDEEFYEDVEAEAKALVAEMDNDD